MKNALYWLADKFFTGPMDEAFNSGVRHGQWLRSSRIIIDLEYRTPKDLTKVQKLGYERAIETIRSFEDKRGT